MIKLIYSKANQAYLFVFAARKEQGYDSCSLISMGVENRHFFFTKEEAEQAAKDRGLTIRPDGIVQAVAA